jgi:hypothetical protein
MSNLRTKMAQDMIVRGLANGISMLKRENAVRASI